MIDEIISILRAWMHERKTGKVVINFFKGGIANIKVEETMHLGKKDPIEKRLKM